MMTIHDMKMLHLVSSPGVALLAVAGGRLLHLELRREFRREAKIVFA
jgi:hypothetical protein